MLQPMEAFWPATVKVVLGCLLAGDIIGKSFLNCDGNGKLASENESDFERITLSNSFHGGLLTVGYDAEGSMILKAQVIIYGKFC